MRDVERIPIILARLEKLWRQYPDWRLTQLINNTMSFYGSDLYYVEDDEFIDRIEKYFKSFYDKESNE